MKEEGTSETPFEPVSSKDETFGAEAPVTGKSQMQAAWSADSGDDEAGAQVAAVPEGQIFEQIYKPWEGTLNPRWMRNWAILRHQKGTQALEHTYEIVHIFRHYCIDDRCCNGIAIRHDWRARTVWHLGRQ